MFKKYLLNCLKNQTIPKKELGENQEPVASLDNSIEKTIKINGVNIIIILMIINFII